MVSNETTYTDYIQYAIEQSKPLDFSLRYQCSLTLEYLLFYFTKKQKLSKRNLRLNSRFSKPVILILQWHHELWLFIIISGFVFVFCFCFHRHQWNTNLSSETSFNLFVKKNTTFTLQKKRFLSLISIYMLVTDTVYQTV